MAEGVLITGMYGSGKSSVAAEIAYLLQERCRPGSGFRGSASSAWALV
jgi:nucleoside-triphosphatase THEP1